MIEKMFGLLKDVHASVKKMEVDVETLKIDMNGLTSDVSGLKQDVSGLKSDVSGLKQDVAELKIGQFQHSVAILELKEDVQKIDTRLIRTEKRVNEMHGMLESVTKKVANHDDEIKVNLGLYDSHEKGLTTVETHLRLA